MAVGQAALATSLDVAELDAVETRLEVLATEVCRQHARLLRTALQLHAVHTAGGCQLSTVPQLALLLQLSDGAAHALLAEARLLASLPGGLEALECGLLTVAQSAVLVRAVGDRDPAVQVTVWRRLQARLLAQASDGTVLTPARLASLLARWIITADPADAAERRRAAEAAGDVAYRRRPDGLGDLFATGVPAPLLRAVLCRIRDASRPWGSGDERSAGKRRLDALINLILGRVQLPFGGGGSRKSDDAPEPTGGEEALVGQSDAAGRRCGPRCGCRLDAPSPCGADVVVHVPLGAALGITDELGELVGHGPLHPDQLQQMLLASPRLRAVHVDAHGVPVSVDDAVHVPPRDDPAALRATLLRLAQTPLGPWQPRHPHDHQTPEDHRSGMCRSGGPPHSGADDGGSGPAVREGPPQPADDRGVAGAGATGRLHPPRTPGPYRPSRRLRRLVELRAPLCEWPACGVRSALCDYEHDDAWPTGPTCACNGGPLCRRHHRVKQQLMIKSRGESSAVRWTDPTGRRWTSRGQHTPPAPAVRPLPQLVPAEPHDLSHAALAELHAGPDDDPVRFELRTLDVDPEQPGTDRLAERLLSDTRWGLDLDDPFHWAA